MAAAFLAVAAAAFAFLADAPSFGWALVALFLAELAYLTVLTIGITVRQMLDARPLVGAGQRRGQEIAEPAFGWSGPRGFPGRVTADPADLRAAGAERRGRRRAGRVVMPGNTRARRGLR